jgi:uncharacterized protein (UPF0147 family)
MEGQMGLRKFYSTQSLVNVVWLHLAYLVSRLASDPRTAEHVPAATALLGRVENTLVTQRAARFGQIAAQAKIDYLNYTLDKSVVRCSRALLNLPDIDQDTAHPRYARYYKEPLSKITRLALEPELRIVRAWIESLRGEPEPEVQVFAQLFQDNVTAGEEAIRQRDGARAAKKDHQVREVIRLIDDINKDLKVIHSKLSAKAAEQKLGADWADSFFYTPQQRSEIEDPADTTRNAIYAVLAAHGIAVSDEVAERLAETDDVELLDRWLARAVTAKSAEEAVGLSE